MMPPRAADVTLRAPPIRKCAAEDDAMKIIIIISFRAPRMSSCVMMRLMCLRLRQRRCFMLSPLSFSFSRARDASAQSRRCALPRARARARHAFLSHYFLRRLLRFRRVDAPQMPRLRPPSTARFLRLRLSSTSSTSRAAFAPINIFADDVAPDVALPQGVAPFCCRLAC